MGIIVLVCVGLLAGCTQKSKQSETANKQITSNKVTSVKSVYYQNLSKADKEKIRFDFTIDADDTQDNVADPVYVVSMKITNHTQKIIKFEQSKFVYLFETDKALSKRNGSLSIKPNQTQKVNQLFEQVPEQATVGTGIIEYLNKDNKLAYADFKNSKVSSDSLNSTKLIAMNKSVTGSNSDQSTDSESSESSSVDSETDSTSSSEVEASSTSRLTEEQAKVLLAKAFEDADSFGGYTIDELSTIKGSTGGWSFVNPDGLSWFVSPDGVVKGPGDK